MTVVRVVLLQARRGKLSGELLIVIEERLGCGKVLHPRNLHGLPLHIEDFHADDQDDWVPKEWERVPKAHVQVFAKHSKDLGRT